MEIIIIITASCFWNWELLLLLLYGRVTFKNNNQKDLELKGQTKVISSQFRKWNPLVLPQSAGKGRTRRNPAHFSGWARRCGKLTCPSLPVVQIQPSLLGNQSLDEITVRFWILGYACRRIIILSDREDRFLWKRGGGEVRNKIGIDQHCLRQPSLLMQVQILTNSSLVPQRKLRNPAVLTSAKR